MALHDLLADDLRGRGAGDAGARASVEKRWWRARCRGHLQGALFVLDLHAWSVEGAGGRRALRLEGSAGPRLRARRGGAPWRAAAGAPRWWPCAECTSSRPDPRCRGTRAHKRGVSGGQREGRGGVTTAPVAAAAVAGRGHELDKVLDGGLAHHHAQILAAVGLHLLGTAGEGGEGRKATTASLKQNDNAP